MYIMTRIEGLHYLYKMDHSSWYAHISTVRSKDKVLWGVFRGRLRREAKDSKAIELRSLQEILLMREFWDQRLPLISDCTFQGQVRYSELLTAR